LWDSGTLNSKGHAIECRLYAEDPYNNGIPSTGTIREIYLPHGPGRRFDMGVECGDTVTSHYDSMIGKVIVWDESRYRAIRKMCVTLRDLIIFGVRTNIPMLLAMLSHTEFVEGKMTTRFVEEYFSKPLVKKHDEESLDRIVKVALEHQVS